MRTRNCTGSSQGPTQGTQGHCPVINRTGPVILSTCSRKWDKQLNRSRFVVGPPPAGLQRPPPGRHPRPSHAGAGGGPGDDATRTRTRRLGESQRLHVCVGRGPDRASVRAGSFEGERPSTRPPSFECGHSDTNPGIFRGRHSPSQFRVRAPVLQRIPRLGHESRVPGPPL